MYDELGALTACLDAYMVHVEIEVPETQLCLSVLKTCIGAYARQGCIPPLRSRHVGCLRDPEVARVEQAEAVALVEYGLVFAAVDAVVTPHTDIVVFGQCGQQVVELVLLDLLRAEYVEVDPLDLLAYYGAASLPAVSVAGIASIIVAHVVCAYGERLCLDRCGEQQQYDRKKSFGGV